MQRRHVPAALILLSLVARPAGAQPAPLRPTEAARAARALLQQGVQVAVDQLGRPDGFWARPGLRISLPPYLEDAATVLRGLGQRQRLDDLQRAMNRAAETAVPLGRDILLQAVQQLSLGDAAELLRGGDTAVTAFFERRTRDPLTERFRPVVQRATEQVGLARQYDAVAGRAQRMGLLRPGEGSVAEYVTGRTLDGLFSVVAEQERRLRDNPAAAASSLLRRALTAR